MNQVTYTVRIEPETVPVRGNYMATEDPEADKRAEDKILARLRAGDESAWCTIVVEAAFEGFKGSDSLGCCVLTSDYTAEQCAEYHGMKASALSDLIGNVKSAMYRGQAAAQTLSKLESKS